MVAEVPVKGVISMSLDIFAENQTHKFYLQDFFDSERMIELKKVSAFASSLTASGDELELIKQRIEGIPLTRGRVCEWRQPFTAFILSNLIEVQDAN